MTTAIAVYLLVSLGALHFEERLLRSVSDAAVANWLVENLYIPLLRYVCVLVFVLLAYPGLFGLDTAPPLSVVLGSGSGRLDQLLNLGLVLSLALPLIPVVNNIPGVILTLQGILTACVVFSWAAPELGLYSPRYWMGGQTLFLVLAFNLAAYLLGRALSEGLGLGRRSPRAALLMDALRYLAGLPAILVYTFALGRQF